jgi:hypothetical protein
MLLELRSSGVKHAVPLFEAVQVLVTTASALVSGQMEAGISQPNGALHRIGACRSTSISIIKACVHLPAVLLLLLSSWLTHLQKSLRALVHAASLCHAPTIS